MIAATVVAAQEVVSPAAIPSYLLPSPVTVDQRRTAAVSAETMLPAEVVARATRRLAAQVAAAGGITDRVIATMATWENIARTAEGR